MNRKFSTWLFAGALLAMNVGSLSAQTAVGPTLSIPLFPGFDNFGNQFAVVQTWDNGTGPRTAFSIYDTGASVVTLSANDQALFELLAPGQAVPIKTPGGASATAIGGSGTLIGDVSQPGAVRAAGLSAFVFDLNTLDFGVDPLAGIEVPGIQMFVGTPSGSSVLPTITGTPIHIPSSAPGHENGTAALVDMRSYQLDLGALLGDPLFENVFLAMPDVAFVPRGASIAGKVDTFEPVHIPVVLYGEDNTANPGELPSASYNPVVPGVQTTSGLFTDTNRTMLFDTGAQLSIISTEMAEQLGLNLDSPETSIDVQGASGGATIPGYTLDTLRLPRDVPGTFLEFTDVPVFVLDIGHGIDGILGMNLFNGADEILYDPFRAAEDGGPLFSVSFLEGRTTEYDEQLADILPVFNDEFEQTIADFVAAYTALLEELNEDPAYDFDIPAEVAGLEAQLAMISTGFGSRFAVQGPLFVGVQPVPEPATHLLALLGLAAISRWVRRRRGV
jgi:predicted aspartyl protease